MPKGLPQRQTQQPDSRPPEPLSPLELALVQALARVVVDRHLASRPVQEG